VYFGHGFLDGQYDDGFDRLQTTYDFGTVKLTTFSNKQVETSPSVAQTANIVTGEENLSDFDDYGAILIADLGDFELGGMAIYHRDNRQTAGVDNLDGTDIGIYAKGDISGIGVGAEIAFVTGDRKILTSPQDETPFGLMAYASTSVGAIGLKVDVAYLTNGYEADNNYVPTLLVGTDQNTALFDLKAEDNANTWLIAGSADTDVMDNVNVLGRLAYVSIQNEDDAGDAGTIFEIDGVVKVQLAKNARWILEASYGSPTDITASDDGHTMLAHKAEVYF
jgi:hypothetical protein